MFINCTRTERFAEIESETKGKYVKSMCCILCKNFKLIRPIVVTKQITLKLVVVVHKWKKCNPNRKWK